LYLFGKVLNALLLSPIETDVARLHFVNGLIRAGSDVYGSDFLARINQHLAPKGNAPLKIIDDLVIRPSEDLGRLAADVVREDPELEFGMFLDMLRKLTGAGTTAREADLLSYLLFDASYAGRLIEIGYKDAEAREADLAAFFTD
jgi:NTE family protein